MAKSLDKQVEEMGMAFIYAIILIGSVGLSFWSTLNLSALDTTQQLAFGLILTFMCLGLGFGFMRYMRSDNKR